MANIISASILGAKHTELGAEIKRAEQNGVEWLHYDVMDGVFVNNISFGVDMLRSIRRVTDMTLDVHLMIADPYRYAEAFASAGADIITFHVESSSDTSATIEKIRSLGVKVGLSVKPATPAEVIFPYLDKLDMALVMTVEPGFGGQGFIPDTLDKVSALRAEAKRRGLSLHIEVDGGINASTAPLAHEAGADVIVSGSYLFGAKDMSAAVKSLRF